MKSTAKAPANIAFVKYWGKKDDDLRLPSNSSFSMNLDNAYSITTVEFNPELPNDDIAFVDNSGTQKEIERMSRHVNRIRKLAHIKENTKVRTKNSFPKGAGAASSASGFAALTLAGTKAAGLDLTEKDLTILARIGSGSACRSIPDGYVIWEEGLVSDSSFAYSLYPASYWQLCDVLVIVDSSMKKVSTTEGHEGAATSPLFQKRVVQIPSKMQQLKNIFTEKNFTALGELIEKDCLNMHHVMQTQVPPLFYWNETTILLMDKTREWRHEGIPVYFTIDAGPNVHLICEPATVQHLVTRLQGIDGVKEVIQNSVSEGTKSIDVHLF